MEEIAFDTETTSLCPLKARLVGVSFFGDGQASYFDCRNGIPENDIESILINSSILIGHNIKYDVHLLKNHGINYQGQLFDTMIAAHVLAKEGVGLKERANDVGMQLTPYEEIDPDNPIELAEYAKKDAEATYKLKQFYQPLLIKNDLNNLFTKIEMPLIEVLVDMERTGVKINRSYLEKIKQELPLKISALETKLYELTKKPININSPKQIADLIFKELKHKPIKFSKKTNDPSVDSETLEELADGGILHAQIILEHRTLSKLLSTFVTPILEGLDDDDRIHTSFNQAVTATGRLSSSGPNLQNIPVRSGGIIRQAFVAGKGKKLIRADYSQIELRVLAHFSQDRVMVEAFKNNRDLHTETASLIFKIPAAQVTPETRHVAKTLNFGIIYGMGPERLAKTLKISVSDAQKFIRQYFLIYRETKQFEARMIRFASQKGYTKTLFGRRRPLPEINSYNSFQRSSAERMAVNTPIQGTAAEIIKLSMIALHNEFKGTETKMLLQIHDELVFETPEREAVRVAGKIKEVMEHIVQLRVPLVVEVKVCDNWADEAVG